MRVLITGGTGSLGHALCRMFLAAGAEQVCVFSRDEVKQAHMAARFPDARMRFLLGDVRDKERLKLAFHGCHAVIHAAALKRVDAVADSPDEVFKTNLDGTRNVLAAALSARVPKVLVISSDKACYPTNAYGISKAAAEAEAVSWNRYLRPRRLAASILRYGNVLGSRGSVVHVWRAQLKAGDPVTITDASMTRFIITMPQAAHAVAQALATMEGGEIFVPMLPAATMRDLLEAVAPDTLTRITGLRPGGEKLHETLLTGEESRRTIDSGQNLGVIRPHLHEWQAQDVWSGYELVEPGEWRSDGALMLGVPQLRGLLETVPTEGV